MKIRGAEGAKAAQPTLCSPAACRRAVCTALLLQTPYLALLEGLAGAGL